MEENLHIFPFLQKIFGLTKISNMMNFKTHEKKFSGYYKVLQNLPGFESEKTLNILYFKQRKPLTCLKIAPEQPKNAKSVSYYSCVS